MLSGQTLDKIYEMKRYPKTGIELIKAQIEDKGRIVMSIVTRTRKPYAVKARYKYADYVSDKDAEEKEYHVVMYSSPRKLLRKTIDRDASKGKTI